MGRPSRDKPRTFSGDWPDGPCDDHVAEEIRLIVVKVRDAIADSGRSLRDVAAEVGTSHAVLAALLAGEVWPEVATVVRLGRVLGLQFELPSKVEI